jgi:hypothetical protein
MRLKVLELGHIIFILFYIFPKITYGERERIKIGKTFGKKVIVVVVLEDFFFCSKIIWKTKIFLCFLFFCFKANTFPTSGDKVKNTINS